VEKKVCWTLRAGAEAAYGLKEEGNDVEFGASAIV